MSARKLLIPKLYAKFEPVFCESNSFQRKLMRDKKNKDNNYFHTKKRVVEHTYTSTVKSYMRTFFFGGVHLGIVCELNEEQI